MTEFKTAYRPVDVDVSALSDEDKQSIFSHLESRGVVAPRKDGIIKEGAQGVASGLLQFGQGVASTLDEAGISGPYEYLKGVAERNQQLNPYPGYKASNLTDLTGLVRTAGTGVGQFMLPVLVGTGATVVSGGASAPGIASGIGTSFLQIYGDEAKSYREAMPDQDPKMANALAFISSALQAGVEVGFGPEKVARGAVQSIVSNSLRNAVAKKVQEVGKKGARKWLFGLAKAMGEGAFEEGVADEGTQLMISNVFKSLGKGKLSMSSPEEYMENIAGGAIPGALFGGAGHVISNQFQTAAADTASATTETGIVPTTQNAQEGQQGAEAVTPTNDTGEAVVTPQGAPAQATIESGTQPNLLGQHQEFTMQEGETQTPPSREEQEFRRASLMAVGMLSKVTGTNVEILDDQALATAEKSAGGQINGFHNPATGKIYINPNAPDGVVFAFGHELLHDVARKTPDVLDTFYKVLQKDLTDKGKQEIMALKERYAPIMDAIEEQNMQKLSKRDRKTFRANYVKEEFGADTLGKILEHPEAVEELAYRFELQRAGMGEKFLMQIKHFLEQAMKKLKGYISRNQAAADLFHNYEEVHDEAMKVLTKLAERNAIRNTPRLQEGQNVRTDQTVQQPEVDVTGIDEKVRKAREEQEYKAKENLELDAQIAKLEKEEAKAAETAKRRKEQEDIQSRAAEEKAARLKETRKLQEDAAFDKEIEKLEKEEGVAQIEKDMDLHPKTRLLDTRERKGLKQLVSRLASIPPKSLSSISPKKLGDVISAMEQNGMASGREYALLKKVLNKIHGVSEKVTPMQAMDRQKIEPPKHESYRESVKVKTSSIKVDPARFQFKSNTEKKTGVDKSNVIGGEWDPVTAGTIYLWEDKHGNRYVVNGHHRLFLAKSQNIPYIRADIDREVDGVTEREARTKGVLMNIRDGQGQVKDYVDFIKEENIDRKTAEEQGILSRAKGRAGFNIATKAGNTLYPAYKAGQVTDAQAETIANVAEGDEGLEFAGLKMTKSMNLDELNIAMNRLKNHLAGKQHRKEQLSLFDMDDSAYKTIVATAKIISKRKNELKQDIASIKNPINKKARASKAGVNVTAKAEANLREYEKQLAVLQQNVLPKELDQDIINQAVKEGLLSKDDVNISEEMDQDFPLMTKEENANDFQLVAESQKEAAAREAKGKQEELDEKERIRKKAAAATPELKFSLRSKPAPEKTKKAYKLFRVDENGNPHALFIDRSNALQTGKWYDADSPAIKDMENLAPGHTYLVDKNGNARQMEYTNKNQSPSKAELNNAPKEGQRYIYVGENRKGQKTYYNWGVNGSGSIAQFAMRPGWHATNVPSARHIGASENGQVKYRRPDERWFEVELAADKDYNAEAQQNAHGDIPGHLPEDGWYSFQTNTNADKKQDWYISGALKINRALDKAEADTISEDLGYNPDLPYDTRFSVGNLHHGTVADFERPDTHYIGSGEGAQVYGWGIYATDVLGIARAYAQADYERKGGGENNNKHLKNFKMFAKENSNTDYDFSVFLNGKEYIGDDNFFQNSNGKNLKMDPKKLGLTMFISYGHNPDFVKDYIEREIRYETKMNKYRMPIFYLKEKMTSETKKNIDHYKKAYQYFLDFFNNNQLEIVPFGTIILDKGSDYDSVIDTQMKKGFTRAQVSTAIKSISEYSFPQKTVDHIIEIYQNKPIIKKFWENVKKILSDSEFEKSLPQANEGIKRNLYTFTFWPDRQEDLLLWNKAIPESQIQKIKAQAKKENITIDDSLFNGEGGEFYDSLNLEVLHSPQKTSEFLLRAGIDGVKYPAASMGRGDGSKGWNYVAFSDKDIRVDDHIRYSKVNEQGKVEAKFDQVNPVQTDEQIKQEYQDMIDNATVTKTTLPEFIRRAKDWIERRGSIEAAAKEIVKGDTDRVLGTFISRLIMDSEQFKDLPDNLRDDVEFNYALQGSEWSMQGMARQIRNLTLDTIGKIQRVFNKMKKESQPEDWDRTRDDILEETGIDINDLPENIVEDKDKLDDVLTKYFTKNASKNDKAYEWWINSILSAPTTHITNILGDIGNFTYELGAKRLVETAVNTLFRRKNGPTFGEFRTMWSAFNFKDAWKRAMEGSKREVLTNESKLYRYHPAIEGKLGKRVRIPGRWLKFADEVFKGIIEPMEATAMAYREGVKKGLKGDALQEFIKTELNDAGSASNKYGKEQARKLTFQEDPGQFIQKLASLKNSDSMAGTVIKYLFPFISTPANIIRQGVRKSPLGIINLAGETVSAIKNKQVSDEYLGHVAEQLIAFSILGLLASGDDDDMPFITGSSAQYGSAEQRFKQNKIPPYSIRIGDKYYSYQRMDPFATGLALMVDGINAYRSAKTDKDVGKALGKFFKTSAKMISEKTYLESLGQVVEIAENPEQGIKWASSFASSWVPNFLKKFISAMDNEIRDTKSYEKGSDFLTEQMWLTAARSGLVKMAPKVDYFGREITKNQTQDMGLGDFVWNLFSPVMAVDPNLDKVERMVWKYNKANPNSQYWMSIPSPSGVVNGKKYYFSGDNYHDFAVQSGQLARKMMDEAIKKGLLNVNNPTDKDISRIKKIFTEARRITKEKFVKRRLVKFL